MVSIKAGSSINGTLLCNGEKLYDIVFTTNETNFPNVKKVKFYDRTTVIWWDDGTKTHVVAQPNDKFDKEKGIAMCFMKKAFDNKGNFNDKLTVLLGENLQEKRKTKRKERRDSKKK